MTIASAASAIAPALTLAAAIHTLPDGQEGGAPFAAQLSGFTLVLPGADAWQPAEPSRPTAHILSTAAPQLAAPAIATTKATPPAHRAIHTETIAIDPVDPPAQEDTTEPQAAVETAPQAPVQPAQHLVVEPAVAAQIAAAPIPAAEPQPALTAPTTTPTATAPVKPRALPAPEAAPPISAKRSTAKIAPHRQAASTAAAPVTNVVVPLPAPAPQFTAPVPEDSEPPAEEPDSNPPETAAISTGETAAAVEPVAPPAPPPAASTAHPQEMAFATRVQPVENTSKSALPAEMASAAAVASASKKIVAASEEIAPTVDPRVPISTAPVFDRAIEARPAAIENPPAVPIASRHIDTPAPLSETLPKPAAAPLTGLTLHLTQSDNQSVDVKVVQQGGEVHVSVHSSDSSLTSGLRQGLPDLQNRLSENGFRSEMWRPAAAPVTVAAPPATQSSAHQGRPGDGQPSQGGSQQDHSGRRNPNPSAQPRWVEELETSLAGDETSSGGFYGFTS